jgi:RNA polymerase sigma-70 factor (ECF subfamily)
MRDLTLSEIDRLQLRAEDGEVAFEMDEDAFRAFYDRTARPLWVYLSRVAGDRQVADDLLQETYYRFLRARVAHESESHRRHYLFRIATNLAHDRHRRRAASPESRIDDTDCALLPSQENLARLTEQRTDLRRAFGRLKPRERELLWLAYAQGSSHREIGETLGLKTGSIKLLLFRARRKLAGLLRAAAPAEGLRREN